MSETCPEHPVEPEGVWGEAEQPLRAQVRQAGEDDPQTPDQDAACQHYGHIADHADASIEEHDQQHGKEDGDRALTRRAQAREQVTKVVRETDAAAGHGKGR